MSSDMAISILYQFFSTYFGGIDLHAANSMWLETRAAIAYRADVEAVASDNLIASNCCHDIV